VRRQALEHQLARRHGHAGLARARQAGRLDERHQPGHHAEALEERVGVLVVRDLQRAALVEPVHDGVAVGTAQPVVVHGAGRAADQLLRDGVRAGQLALVLELQLAGNGGHGRVHVGDAGHHRRFAGQQRAPLGVGHHVLEHGDGQALAHAGALVHPLVGPRLERDALDQFGHEVRHLERAAAGLAALDPRLLPRDGHAQVHAARVVRGDLRADAVLERGDDLAAGGIVLGIRGEHQRHVERQPDRIAFDLDVAFLHDVEQAHLDLGREVRQLVDREDAAVGARQQAVVDRQLVGQQVAAARRLDRVHVADDVGDGDVRRGELLDVTLAAVHPADRRGVAALVHDVPAVLRNGSERVVVHLAPGQHRHLVVQQLDQGAHDARLGLAAQAEQDEVVAGEDGVDELRYHGVVVADDAGKHRRPGREPAQQVVAHFVAHAAARAGGPAGVFQLAERSRLVHADQTKGARGQGRSPEPLAPGP
jgi:hypothetical protein